MTAATLEVPGERESALCLREGSGQQLWLQAVGHSGHVCDTESRSGGHLMRERLVASGGATEHPLPCPTSLGSGTGALEIAATAPMHGAGDIQPGGQDCTSCREGKLRPAGSWLLVFPYPLHLEHAWVCQGLPRPSFLFHPVTPPPCSSPLPAWPPAALELWVDLGRLHSPGTGDRTTVLTPGLEWITNSPP